MDGDRILAELSNEELLRGLIEGGDNIFAIVDVNGRFLYCSAPDQYGISASDVVGKVYADFWPSEITAMYRRHLEEVLRGGQSIITEDHVVWQGQDLWFFNHKYPIRDRQGEIVAVGSVSRNITERKRAEEAMAHSHRLLLALSRAAQALHRAHTPEAVYRAIGEQANALGLDAAILTLSEDRAYLTASYLTLASDVLCAAEKLTGISWEGYRFPLEPDGFFQRIRRNAKPAFAPDVALPFAETLPRQMRPLAQRLIDLFGWQRGIIAPLVIGNEICGFLAITGVDLMEADVPAIMAFADQAAIALENARLYKETRHLADFNQRIIQGVAEGIVMEDAGGVFTFVNPAAAEILGYTPGELIGLHWTAITPPDQHVIVHAADARRGQGEADRYELTLVRKDGQRISVLMSGTPHFDAEGRFAGSLSAFTDITARKQMEEEVEFQAMVLNQIRNSVVVTDLEGNILYVNNEALRNQRREREGLLGKTVEVYGEDPSRGATQQQIRACTLENGEWYGEVVNYAADGTEVIMDLRTKLIEDEQGKPWRMVGIGNDITERKRMEEALRESEEKYRTISEVVSDLAYSLRVEPDGRLVPEWMTDSFTRIMGFAPDEMFSQDMRNFISPAEHLSERMRIVLSGEPSSYEWRVRTKRGEIRWLHNYARPMWDEALGRVVRIVGAAQDVTARRQMEEQLRAALQEKEAMMIEIHHRVRNSLQVIINLLTFQANHTQDEATLAVLRDSRRRVKSMAMIHEQLYQVANFTEVDLAEYIPTLATNLLAAYRANLGPVELRLDLRKTILDVKQAMPCGLIVSELVSNALRHAFPSIQDWPEGFVGEIFIALHSAEKMCILHVMDNGKGLPNDFSFPDERTLGMFLIKTFAEQLNAMISWENSGEAVGSSRALYPGTSCCLEFMCC
jgi:PAS domain S-box-containing protein